MPVNRAFAVPANPPARTEQPLYVSPSRALALITLTTAGAILIDYLLVPPSTILSVVYALPALVAALVAPRGVVRWVAPALLVFQIIAAILQQIPLDGSLYQTIGLAFSLFLIVLLAEQRDATAKRAAEAEAARQRLEESVAIVAHELKSPLSAVMGQTQLLARRPDLAPERQARGLALIDSAAQHIQRLIDDLSDMASISVGRFEISRAATDIAAIARTVAEARQILTTEHAIVVVAPDSLVGDWDPVRIRQLTVNLVSNAVKYSPAGGEVRISVERAGDQAILAVADQGVGVSPAQQRQLFQPFSRLQQVPGVAGSGLGLYIAQAIATAHGGRISVQSNPGQGSTFSVSLPIERRD